MNPADPSEQQDFLRAMYNAFGEAAGWRFDGAINLAAAHLFAILLGKYSGDGEAAVKAMKGIVDFFKEGLANGEITHEKPPSVH